MNLVIKMRRASLKIDLLLIYTISICVCYILPFVKYSVSYVPEAIALLLTYLFYIESVGGITKLLQKILFCSVGLMIMTLLVMHQGSAKESINEFVRSMRFFAPGLLYLMFFQRGAYGQRGMKYIFWVLSALFAFICIRTIQGVREVPLLARILASGELDEEMTRFRFQNVGGFEFCYAVGFILLAMFALFMIKRRPWEKVAAMTMVVFGAYFVVVVEYMLLFLIVCIGCYILAFSETKNVIGKFALILLLVVAPILIPVFFGFIQNMSGDMLSGKISSFLEFLTGEAVSILGSRPRLYMEAFLRFLSSPLWGNPASINGVEVAGMIENHSTLFGYLQGMGVFGGIFFYVPLIAMIREIRNTFYENYLMVKAYDVICAMFIVLSVVNPIQYCFEICFVVFLYIPCAVQVYVPGRRLDERWEYYGKVED